MNPHPSRDSAPPTGQGDGVVEAKVCLNLTGSRPVVSVDDNIEALLGFTANDYLSGQVSLTQQIHQNPETDDVRCRQDGRLRGHDGQHR